MVFQDKKENDANPMTSDHSEYDSADSYSDEGDSKDAKLRSRSSDPGNHSNSESGGSITLEREEGDGQESAPQKKVDDDEDKKNPQYIPKRGTFYEHDDRTLEEEGEVQVAEVEKDGKKKVWQDKKERWAHDRFNETEQSPKTKSELINIYGYDIRNEEGPPRARRRRRYGRGPNKYTRNWEDEEAYNKPAPKAKLPAKKQSRPIKNVEDFPPLISDQSGDTHPANDSIDSSEDRRDSVDRQAAFQPPAAAENSPEQINRSRNYAQEAYQERSGQRMGSDRPTKPKKEIKDSDYRGFTTKTRQQRPIKTDQQKVLPRSQQQPKPDFIQTQNYTNKSRDNAPQSIQDMEKEMSKLSVDGVYKGGNKHGSQRQGSVPPRLQSEHSKGSKRYSSMRQRSLPEANTPPAAAYPTTFYPNEYNGQGQQPLPPTALPPPPAAAPLIPAQYPPTGFPPGAAPPPFVAAPPQFIPPPPQQPQIINFVQAAAAAGQPPFAPPNFQGYQQQFNPVTQPPAELYQPQGITYYSTDQQVGQQRPAPQKRPKAAIPIVAPPEQKKDDTDELQTIESGGALSEALDAKQ
ncbi:unnamed protein product [Acanthoscelides obtectus]|uniref:Protein CASC3 n=1 Tax=Acanthoscelides obtectus TaxID=200917 RepID=A0A9P0MF02_ACAOB|nr:unnamed protein product [Acanthoscelides obtectus]CAK1679751.1 Protein CASC3 [Acanthoscelides obtectus]